MEKREEHEARSPVTAPFGRNYAKKKFSKIKGPTYTYLLRVLLLGPPPFFSFSFSNIHTLHTGNVKSI